MANHLTVGQRLWLVPFKESGYSCEVEVVKIGRKWAHVHWQHSNYRLDMETMCIDGGQYSSPARCWLNEDEYLAGIRLRKLWRVFYLHLCERIPPTGASEENVLQAASLLGIKLELQP